MADIRKLQDPREALKLFGIETPDIQIPFAPGMQPAPVPEGYNEAAQAEALEQEETEPVIDEDESLLPSDEMMDLSTPPSPIKVPTIQSQGMAIPKTESVLEQYKKMMAERQASIKDAQSMDDRNALSDAIMKGGSKIANAFANRSGRTNINNQAASLLTDNEKRADQSSGRDIESVLNEFKIRQGEQSAALNAQKAKSDEKYKQDMLQLQRDRLASAERIASQKKEDSLEKEIAKDERRDAAQAKRDERKEQAQVNKEDRKLRGELDKAQSSLEEQLSKLKDAEKSFDKYSKGSVVGTGPLATLGGATKYLSQDTEGLDSKFKNISLDSMVKMFAGMSKAVDSDAERRAFESTQPNIALDDATNRQILKDKIAATESLLKKTKESKSRFDKNNSFEQKTSSQSSPSVGSVISSGGKRYRVIDENGNLEEVK